MLIFCYVTIIIVQNNPHFSVCTILHVSERNCRLSCKVIIFLYVISKPSDLLLVFFSACLWHLPLDIALHSP